MAAASERFGDAPAEPPPLTRAWRVTPDAASVGPKKKCMTLLACNPISRLSLHVRKVELATRCMRVVAQVPHGMGAKLDTYINRITLNCPAWTIETVEPTELERAVFSGRQIVRTPAYLSGGQSSSGAEGDELSVISSSLTSASATVRFERELAVATAELDEARARLEAERAGFEAERARLEAERARLSAERDAERAREAERDAERARLEAERDALVEQVRRLQLARPAAPQ